jgi:hypothetical protein
VSGNGLTVITGTINSGGTSIVADISQGVSPGAAVKVTLSTNYQLAFLPGYPNRPFLTGTEVAKTPANFLVLSGTTIALLAPEAAALVAAGAESYA